MLQTTWPVPVTLVKMDPPGLPTPSTPSKVGGDDTTRPHIPFTIYNTHTRLVRPGQFSWYSGIMIMHHNSICCAVSLRYSVLSSKPKLRVWCLRRASENSVGEGRAAVLQCCRLQAALHDGCPRTGPSRAVALCGSRLAGAPRPWRRGRAGESLFRAERAWSLEPGLRTPAAAAESESRNQ